MKNRGPNQSLSIFTRETLVPTEFNSCCGKKVILVLVENFTRFSVPCWVDLKTFCNILDTFEGGQKVLDDAVYSGLIDGIRLANWLAWAEAFMGGRET